MLLPRKLYTLETIGFDQDVARRICLFFVSFAVNYE